jgi:hypothetical protein
MRALGSYQLVESMGSSPSGETWLGRDRDGAKLVIKCYPATASIATFHSRATAMMMLDSPNISRLRDRGKTADTLFTVRDHHPRTFDASSLAAHETLEAAIAIGRALEQAHAHGLVHGAIKPNNIMSADRPVIVDFSMRTDLDPRADQAAYAELVTGMLGDIPSELVDPLERACSSHPFRRLNDLVNAIEAVAGASSAGTTTVKIERIAQTLRVEIAGKWTPKMVETATRQIDEGMRHANVQAIGYLLEAHGGCHSAAIEALTELHRRHKKQLLRVGFVSSTPQARGASILIGTRVQGLTWKTFASAAVMQSWLNEGQT